jgi:hypothetical protein
MPYAISNSSSSNHPDVNLAALASSDSLNPKVELTDAKGPRMCGIGVLFHQDETTGVKRIVVAQTAAGGPADRTGRVRQGDLLVRIDGMDVHGQDLEYVSKYILGPENSLVRLGFYNSDSSYEEEVAINRGIFASSRSTTRRSKSPYPVIGPGEPVLPRPAPPAASPPAASIPPSPPSIPDSSHISIIVDSRPTSIISSCLIDETIDTHVLFGPDQTMIRLDQSRCHSKDMCNDAAEDHRSIMASSQTFIWGMDDVIIGPDEPMSWDDLKKLTDELTDELRADFHRNLEEIQRGTAYEGKRELEEEVRAHEERRSEEELRAHPVEAAPAAPEAQLKAVKTQLHALATEERHPAMPMLHALQAHPAALENAEPVENVAKDEVVSSLSVLPSAGGTDKEAQLAQT